MNSIQPIFVEAVRILQAETINIAGDQGGTVPEAININPAEKDFDVWDNFLHQFNSTHNSELHQARDIELSAFVISLKFNFGLFLGLLALYEFFSRWLPSVYKCRSSEGILDAVNLPKTCLPLNWVPAIMRVSWSQLRRLCGMDNYFFLRYIRMVFQITAVSGLWGLVILWYVYPFMTFVSVVFASSLSHIFVFPPSQAGLCPWRQQRARVVLFFYGKFAQWILEALVSNHLHVDIDLLHLQSYEGRVSALCRLSHGVSCQRRCPYTSAAAVHSSCRRDSAGSSLRSGSL
jgi:hypothetical protein